MQILRLRLGRRLPVACWSRRPRCAGRWGNGFDAVTSSGFVPLTEKVSLMENGIGVAVLVHAVERAAAIEDPVAAADDRLGVAERRARRSRSAARSCCNPVLMMVFGRPTSDAIAAYCAPSVLMRLSNSACERLPGAGDHLLAEVRHEHRPRVVLLVRRLHQFIAQAQVEMSGSGVTLKSSCTKPE